MKCQVSFKNYGFIKVPNKKTGSGDYSIDEQLALNNAVFYYHEKNRTRLIVLNNGRVFIREPLSDGKVLFFGYIRSDKEFEVIKEQISI